MKLTIQEYANTKGVTYENVRAIIERHKEELQDKIEKEGRTRYLTDAAQEFLNKRINVKTISVTDNDAEIIRLNNIIEEQNKLIKEQDKQLKDKDLETENKLLKLQNETLEKVSELEKIINSQKSLVDNNKFLLEQKDKEKETLQKEKDRELNLIATNRKERRKYIKDLKRKAKEEKRAAKENEKAAAVEQE